MVRTEDRYKLSLQTKLLTNPHAKLPLPEWVSHTINSAGEQFDLNLKPKATQKGAEVFFITIFMPLPTCDSGKRPDRHAR
jgi:hypothetical protein